MTNNKKDYRVACNQTNCGIIEVGMPQECNVISFGDDERMKITNSGTKGIFSEEIALGIKIEAVGDEQQEQR